MIYLVLSILSSTCIFLIFKSFEKYRIHNFQAIVFNYIVAALCGLAAAENSIDFKEVLSEPWGIIAVIMGILFISMFNVIAITAQRIGISVASVVSKVSLVIPVSAAVYLYSDSMSLLKSIGILLALFSVFLTFYQSEAGLGPMKKLIIYPIILFIGTGLLDTLLKFTQAVYLSETDFDGFVTILFAIAAIIGAVVVLISWSTGKSQFHYRNVLAGVVLGLPNYGSIYFLLKTFEVSGLESSVVFPVNNISIVVLSAIFAFVFFKEKLQLINWLGILLAVASIAIIAYGK